MNCHSRAAASLYELIWKRTVASQMANARLRLVTATTPVDDALLAAGRIGPLCRFPSAYVEGSDDPDAAIESQERATPPLTVGEQVDCRDLEARASGNQTAGPLHRGHLVKALEAEGIGRLSTYATIIDDPGECYWLQATWRTGAHLHRLLPSPNWRWLPRGTGGPEIHRQHGTAASTISPTVTPTTWHICAASSWAWMAWKPRCARDAQIDLAALASTAYRATSTLRVRIASSGPSWRRKENGERLTATKAARPAAGRPHRRAGRGDSASQARRPTSVLTRRPGCPRR